MSLGVTLNVTGSGLNAARSGRDYLLGWTDKERMA
jgi:hypothetical protein